MSGSPPAFPVDLRQGVIWAYRHLLGREPESEAQVQAHTNGAHGLDALRTAFVLSAEHRGLNPRTPLEAALKPVVDRFQPFSTTPPPAGSWGDFMGVHTRCAFLPAACEPWAGTILNPPGCGLSGVHDEAEWLGTLRSVLEARDRFVLVELGAGWAPWLVTGAAAAKRMGIEDILLIGVEGSAGHVQFMHQHLRDNGIDPAPHRLLHGVVGPADGVASFPKLAQPRDVYGAEADYAGAGDQAEMEEVRSYSLPTLLADVPFVDVLHCDIQGMEGDVFRAAHATVAEKVGRVVVGTHSRAVEGELHALFSANGWLLEADTACEFAQSSGPGPGAPLVLARDGTQVWKNPRLSRGP